MSQQKRNESPKTFGWNESALYFPCFNFFPASITPALFFPFFVLLVAPSLFFSFSSLFFYLGCGVALPFV
jgi:hypothetical protein